MVDVLPSEGESTETTMTELREIIFYIRKINARSLRVG